MKAKTSSRSEFRNQPSTVFLAPGRATAALRVTANLRGDSVVRLWKKLFESTRFSREDFAMFILILTLAFSIVASWPHLEAGYRSMAWDAEALIQQYTSSVAPNLVPR
jgi:hypothetical protein